MTSPSMPSTSVTWVIRREPSLKRVWCTIRSTAQATCSRMARTGRSMPAISTMVSMRASDVARRVGVDGADRAVVAGVHRLQHVERGGVADLADDDAVGAHAQGVADQVADRDLALALDVRRAGLEPHHVVLVELELGGVLDGDDALVVGDERRQHVERRGLAGAGAAGDEDVEPAADAGVEEVGAAARLSVPKPIRSSTVVGVGGELADRQQRAVERQRRDDRVDAAAVGEPGVDHRARLVDATADAGDDLVDRAAQVGLVVEAAVDLVELAAALDVDASRSR